jgi:hypothetical protein
MQYDAQWQVNKTASALPDQPTFLPLVEDGRTRVVLALLIWIGKLFPATLMDTFLRHLASSSIRPALHKKN